MSHRPLDQNHDSSESHSDYNTDTTHRNKPSNSNTTSIFDFDRWSETYNDTFSNESEIHELEQFVNQEDSDIMQVNDDPSYNNFTNYLDSYYANFDSDDLYLDDVNGFSTEDCVSETGWSENHYTSDFLSSEDEYNGLDEVEDDIVYLGSGHNDGIIDLNANEESIIELGQRIRTLRFLGDGRDFAPVDSTRSLTPQEIKKIRVHKYSNIKKGLKEECLICFNKFVNKAVVFVLNCGHIFHKDCVIPWFERDRRCPLCRKDVDTK